jgi:hypothetical protein
MLAVIPVLLLFSTVVLIWVLALVKQRPGTIWLVAAIMVSITWVSTVLVGVLNPQPILINNWLPEPFNFTNLVLSSSPHNWGFGFLLVSLLVAIVYSEAKYLDTPDYVRKIISSILLTAFAMLTVMAGSLLTFVICWALIDLIEFGVLAVLMGQPRTLLTAGTSILFRLVGLILLILLISLTPAERLAADAVEFEVTSSLRGLVVMLVLFRTGTLPLFQPYVNAPAYQRGVVSLLRGIPLLTTFAFIHYIGDAGGVAISGEFWLVIVTIAVLWGGLSWFGAVDEIHGRPYFLFTLAGFGLTALLTGQIDALRGLAVVLVIGGAGLFLYSPRFKKFNLFILVLVAGMLTFPFTPTASIASLFDGQQPFVVKGLWVLALAFIVAGMIKHSLTRIKHTELLETWMLLFHTAALYFISFSPWVMVAVLWNRQPQLLRWAPGITTAVLSGIILTVFLLLKSRMRSIRFRHKGFEAGFEIVTNYVGKVYQFNWLSRVFSSIGFIISRFVNLLARVMEGDGGILWSFLFIVLLLSLLLVRQAP